MRAGLGRCFENAGAEALAAHLHQPKARNAPYLDARPVVLQRLLHRLLDLPDMAVLFHVDEVDDDEARHVAQPELTRDFLRRFEVRIGRSLLDIVLARRAAGVDVDRDQRLGRVDDEIAAGLELDDRLVHRAELVLDAVALEQGRGLRVDAYPPDVARHQELHEAPRRLIAFLAFDDHLVDLAVIEVADGAFDEIAVAINQRRRGAPQGPLADFVPQTREIVEVAL